MISLIVAIGTLAFGIGIMIFMIRNVLVYRIRTRRLWDIDARCKQNLNKYDIDFIKREFQKLDNPSYDRMLWDFRKWTYKSFYKEEYR